FHCLKETPYVTLIDSSKRRLGILEKECVNKDLNNLEFIFERIENIRNRFDLVTARALIPFPFIIEVFSSSIRTGGHAVLFAADNKSLHKTEKEYLDKLGFVSRETLVPDEINVEFTRTIKILEKVKKSSQGYPRPWRKIKEEISVWQKSSV
ncbi:MAG: class I SAM-dependent methyltransferase, partial [Spirochaetia bacterium]|nr:class I SAM-dependent methyltransferase [Spirochaetia bacterium]